MKIDDILDSGPVVAVLAVDDVDSGLWLAEALVEGGVRTLEVTLRTPAALAAVSAIRQRVPDALVGTGTVLNAADLQRSLDAGAVFAVSPGVTPSLLAAAAASPLPFLPGVSDASSLMLALEAGFDRLKFFPAEQSGGIAMLRALAGPFAQVRFCPTGGVSASNAASYLALSNVACVGGSWVAPRDAVSQRDRAAIVTLARETGALRRATQTG